MKAKNMRFILMCIVLFLNIIFTQKMVHQYFYENYKNALIYCALNLVILPAALFLYKYDKKKLKGADRG